VGLIKKILGDKRYFRQNPTGLFLKLSMAGFSQISISKFTNRHSIEYSKY